MASLCCAVGTLNFKDASPASLQTLWWLHLQTLTQKNAPDSAPCEVTQTVTGSRPFETPFALCINIPVGVLHSAKNNSWESVVLMSASQVDPSCQTQKVLTRAAVGAGYERNRGMLWCFRGRYFRGAHSHHDALGSVIKWVGILSRCLIVVVTFLVVVFFFAVCVAFITNHLSLVSREKQTWTLIKLRRRGINRRRQTSWLKLKASKPWFGF